MLREHEATVSRHLARTRREIRALVEGHLRRVHGFSDAGIGECFESVVADSGSLDLAEVLTGTGSRKNAEPDRSTAWGRGTCRTNRRAMTLSIGCCGRR